MLSVARYVVRMAGRPVPFGLMAGVAMAEFTGKLRCRWGNRHRAAARAGAQWLDELITAFEHRPDLARHFRVVASSTLLVRGDRLIVPHQLTDGADDIRPAEVSLRYTTPVQVAVAEAQTPVLLGDLAEKLGAEFASVPATAVTALLAELISRKVLITSLRAPATVPDALGYLIREAEAAGAPEMAALQVISRVLEASRHAAPADARTLRADAARQMRALARTRQHPVAVDLLLDTDIALPGEVAREAARAAQVLARLSAFPAGAPAWRAYHQRFYERYGLGSLVPLLDMISDSGIGWPDGYPGAPAEQRQPVSARDETLLAQAQGAALDGHREIVLDQQRIAALAASAAGLRMPPHLEIGIRLHSTSIAALRTGKFRLEVTTVSRGAGVLTGRFLPVLPPGGQKLLSGALTSLPCGDHDSVPVQLSFPPLDPGTAHVTRAPQVLPAVVSIAEYRPDPGAVLTAADLAVGCDGRRMFLAVPRLGQRIEAAGMHALNLLRHTPPLARLMTELCRAQYAQVTAFSWGAAASLPFLPRLRLGRIIVSPAQWRLPVALLPRHDTPQRDWDQQLRVLLDTRRIPDQVYLAGSGTRLPLDLADPGHRVLLREHLNTAPHAVLTEAPGPADLGWCGGHPHELIIPLTANQTPPWPPLPRPARERVISRNHGHLPGTSNVLLVSVYGDFRRQDTILTGHLPDLLDRLEQPVSWWFIRYRDPDQHLRLRITLPSPDRFGTAAATISGWAGELRRAGLASDLRFPADYPETGRWGSGPAWTAAQAVFHADSRAILTQLTQPSRPPRQALAAAHAAAIAIAFTGSTSAAMRWLINQIPATAPGRVPRPLLDQTRRLADPDDSWAALRAAPGGAAIAAAWQDRDLALAAYRACFPGPGTGGVDPNDVLASLIHVSVVRSYGIDFADEALAMYLARAAALAWTARHPTAGR